MVKIITVDLEALNNNAEIPNGGISANITRNNVSKKDSNPAPSDHENGMFINKIVKLDEYDIEKLWPELIRILVMHADERYELDLETFK